MFSKAFFKNLKKFSAKPKLSQSDHHISRIKTEVLKKILVKCYNNRYPCNRNFENKSTTTWISLEKAKANVYLLLRKDLRLQRQSLKGKQHNLSISF